MTTPRHHDHPRRLITAQDYETAPPHTVVEFDRSPGALGYLNWDLYWEISDDYRNHDYSAAAIAEHDGPSTIIRWGKGENNHPETRS